MISLIIAVVDSQGGGMGKAIIEKLRKDLNENIEIWALGTNVLATSAMIKAGANKGATGENAIVWSVKEADYIMGSVGIIAANAMMGEISTEIANAIASARGKKILIPYNKCSIMVATQSVSTQKSIEIAVSMIEI